MRQTKSGLAAQTWATDALAWGRCSYRLTWDDLCARVGSPLAHAMRRTGRARRAGDGWEPNGYQVA